MSDVNLTPVSTIEIGHPVQVVVVSTQGVILTDNQGVAGPTITSGAGVPNTIPPNGSLYLETSSGGLYLRQNGAWVQVSVAGTP